MKFKTLMSIKAVVCLVFGFLLLVFPGQLLGLMGATLGAAGLFTAREYGAALAGNLVLTWVGRNADESLARRAIVLHMVIYNAIGFIVTLYYVLTGVLNWMGWGIVAVYLFFTIGFGYYQFAKTAAAAVPIPNPDRP